MKSNEYILAWSKDPYCKSKTYEGNGIKIGFDKNRTKWTQLFFYSSIISDSMDPFDAMSLLMRLFIEGDINPMVAHEKLMKIPQYKEAYNNPKNIMKNY